MIFRKLSFKIIFISSLIILCNLSYSANKFFFGQHVFYPESFNSIPGEYFDGIRIWGNPKTTWKYVEPSPGVYDFHLVDSIVASALDRKIDVMYTLGQTPEWSASRPNEIGNFGPGAASEPRNINDWSDYVVTVVRRYHNRISAYEVMNEPRIPEAVPLYSPGFFSGSTSSLIEMTRTASNLIHQVDPKALVVCPSMDGSDYGLKRLEYFLAQGGGKLCDVIGFHFYLQSGSLDEYNRLVFHVRQLLVKYGLGDLPIWNTEIGVLVKSSGNNVYPGLLGMKKVYSDDEASALMIKVYVASSNGGIARTYWFAHDASAMGSTLPDKRSGRANGLGDAYQNVRKWFANGRYVRACVMSDAIANCAVYEGNIVVGRVVWGRPLEPVTWLAANPGLVKVHLFNGLTLNMRSSNASSLSALTRNFADPVFISIN